MNPVDILSDPNYTSANAATKEAIFNKYIGVTSDFTSANKETQDAIKLKFGLLLGQPQEETDAQIAARAKGELIPEGEGFFSSAGQAGIGAAKSTAGGIMQFAGAEESGRGLSKEGQAQGKNYPSVGDLPALYRTEGLGAALKRTLPAIGYDIARTAPVIATGITAGVLAPEVALGGVGAATLAELGVYGAAATGENINRQQAQIEAGTRTELNRGAAVASGIAQGALEKIGVNQILGKAGAIGERVAKQLGAKTAAEELMATSTRTGLGTAGKILGSVAETAAVEGGVEGLQEELGRAQAGQSLTDKEARDAVATSVLGGVLVGGAMRAPVATVSSIGAKDRALRKIEDFGNFGSDVVAGYANITPEEFESNGKLMAEGMSRNTDGQITPEEAFESLKAKAYEDNTIPEPNAPKVENEYDVQHAADEAFYNVRMKFLRGELVDDQGDKIETWTQAKPIADKAKALALSTGMDQLSAANQEELFKQQAEAKTQENKKAEEVPAILYGQQEGTILTPAQLEAKNKADNELRQKKEAKAGLGKLYQTDILGGGFTGPQENKIEPIVEEPSKQKNKRQQDIFKTTNVGPENTLVVTPKGETLLTQDQLDAQEWRRIAEQQHQDLIDAGIKSKATEEMGKLLAKTKEGAQVDLFGGKKGTLKDEVIPEPIKEYGPAPIQEDVVTKVAEQAKATAEMGKVLGKTKEGEQVDLFGGKKGKLKEEITPTPTKEYGPTPVQEDVVNEAKRLEVPNLLTTLKGLTYTPEGGPHPDTLLGKEPVGQRKVTDFATAVHAEVGAKDTDVITPKHIADAKLTGLELGNLIDKSGELSLTDPKVVGAINKLAPEKQQALINTLSKDYTPENYIRPSEILISKADILNLGITPQTKIVRDLFSKPKVDTINIVKNIPGAKKLIENLVTLSKSPIVTPSTKAAAIQKALDIQNTIDKVKAANNKAVVAKKVTTKGTNSYSVAPTGITTGHTIASLSKALSPEMKRLVASGKAVLHDTAATLPGAGHPVNVQGMTTADGVTHYVANKLTPSTIQNVALHEVGVHAGMRKMLGDKLWSYVKNQAMTNQGAAFVKARASVPEGTPDHLIAEEVLAYLVENSPNLSLVRQIVASIRNFMRSKLGANIRLSEADARQMATAAMRKESKTAERTSRDETAFSKEVSKETPYISDDIYAKEVKMADYPHDEKTRAGVSLMTPEQFLALVEDSNGNAEKRADKYGEFKADKFADDIPPALDIDINGKVQDHEGRARAIMAQQAGITKFPVVIRLPKADRVSYDTPIPNNLTSQKDSTKVQIPVVDHLNYKSKNPLPKGVKYSVNKGGFNANIPAIKKRAKLGGKMLPKFLELFGAAGINSIGGNFLKGKEVDGEPSKNSASEILKDARKIAGRTNKLLDNYLVLRKEINTYIKKNYRQIPMLSDVANEATILGVSPAEVNTDSPANIENKIKSELTTQLSGYVDRVKRLRALEVKYTQLNRDSVQMYNRLADYYKKAYADYINAERTRIDTADMSDSEKDRQRKKFNEQMAATKLKGDYFPLMRFGKYSVDYTDGEVDSTTGELIRKFNKFETEAEAEEFASDPKITSEKGVRLDIERHKNLDMAAGNKTMQDMWSTIDKTFEGIDTDNLGEAISEMKDFVFQMHLMGRPEQSIGKRFLHRKGTPGYSGDIFRGFDNYALSMSKQLPRIELSHGITSKLTKLGEELGELPKEKYVEGVKYYNAFNKQLMESVYPKHINQGITTLTGLVFHYYLSSPVSAALQLASIPLQGAPSIAKQHGVKLAQSCLNTATSLYLGSGIGPKTGWWDIKRGAENSKTIQNFVKGASHANQLNIGDAVDRMREEALLVPGIHAQSFGGRDKPTREGNSLFDKAKHVMELTSQPFSQMETASRQIVSIAAYLANIKSGMTHEVAVRKAIDTTYLDLGDYGETGKASMFKTGLGGVAKIAMQFQQYGAKLLFAMGKASYDAIKSEDKTTRVEGAKFIAHTYAMHWVFAGGLGLPLVGLAGFVTDFARDVLGDDDERHAFKEEIRTAMHKADINDLTINLILNGPVGTLTGLDLTDRLGAADLIPMIQESDLNETLKNDVVGKGLQSMGGAFASTAANYEKAVDEFTAGNYGKAIEKILPSFARNIVTANRYAREGKLTAAGLPIVSKDEITTWDIVARALGAESSHMSEKSKASRSAHMQNQFITDRKKELLDKFAKASPAEREKTISEITAFTKKHPGARIDGNTIRNSLMGRMKAPYTATRGYQMGKNIGEITDLYGPELDIDDEDNVDNEDNDE